MGQIGKKHNIPITCTHHIITQVYFDAGILHSPYIGHISGETGSRRKRNSRNHPFSSLVIVRKFQEQSVIEHTEIKTGIQELDREVFSLSLLMPDQATAEAARDAFIHKGGDFYKILLAMFSGNETLAAEWLQKL